MFNKPYNLLIEEFLLHNSTLDSSFPLRKMQTNHNAIIVTWPSSGSYESELSRSVIQALPPLRIITCFETMLEITIAHVYQWLYWLLPLWPAFRTWSIWLAQIVRVWQEPREFASRREPASIRLYFSWGLSSQSSQRELGELERGRVVKSGPNFLPSFCCLQCLLSVLGIWYCRWAHLQ